MIGRLLLFIALIMVGAGLVMPVACAADECEIIEHGLFNPERFEGDTDAGVVANLYGLLLLAVLIPGLVAFISFDRTSVSGSALVITLVAGVVFAHFYLLDDQNLGWGWGLIGAGCLFALASAFLTPVPVVAAAAIPMPAPAYAPPGALFPQGGRPAGPAAGLHHTIIAGEEPIRPQAAYHTIIEENFNAAPPQQPYYQAPAAPPVVNPFEATRIDSPFAAAGSPPPDPMGATMIDNRGLNVTQAGQRSAPPPVDPNEATRIDSGSLQAQQPYPPQPPAAPPSAVDDQAMYKTVIDAGHMSPPTPPAAPPPMTPPAAPVINDMERTNVVPIGFVSDLPLTDKVTPPPNLPPVPPMERTAQHQVTPPSALPQAPQTPPTPPPTPTAPPSDISVSQILRNVVGDFSLDEDEGGEEAPPAPMNPTQKTFILPDSQSRAMPAIPVEPSQSTPQLDEPSVASVRQESQAPSEKFVRPSAADTQGEVASEVVQGEGEIPFQEFESGSDEVIPDETPSAAHNLFKTQIDTDDVQASTDDNDDAAMWKTQIDIDS